MNRFKPSNFVQQCSPWGGVGVATTRNAFNHFHEHPNGGGGGKFGVGLPIDERANSLKCDRAVGNLLGRGR